MNDMLAKELGMYMEQDQPIRANIAAGQILFLYKMNPKAMDKSLVRLASSVQKKLADNGYTEEQYILKVMEHTKKNVPHNYSVCQQRYKMYDMPTIGQCPTGQVPRYGEDYTCCMDVKEYLKLSKNNVTTFLSEVQKADPQLAAQLAQDWKGTTNPNPVSLNTDSTAFKVVRDTRDDMTKKLLQDLQYEEGMGDEKSNAYKLLGFSRKDVWLRTKYYVLKTASGIEGFAKFIVNNVISLQTIFALTLLFKAIKWIICSLMQGYTNLWKALLSFTAFLDKTLGTGWEKLLNYGAQMLEKGLQLYALVQLLVTVATTFIIGSPIGILLFMGVGMAIGISVKGTALNDWWQYIRNVILRYVGTVQILQAVFGLATETMQLTMLIHATTISGGNKEAMEASMKLLCTDNFSFAINDDDSITLKGSKIGMASTDTVIRLLNMPINIMHMLMCWGVGGILKVITGNDLCASKVYANGKMEIPSDLKDAFTAHMKTLRFTDPARWHFDYLPMDYEKESKYESALKTLGVTMNTDLNIVRKKKNELSQKYHTDKKSQIKGTDNEKMREINDAFAIIKNIEKHPEDKQRTRELYIKPLSPEELKKKDSFTLKMKNWFSSLYKDDETIKTVIDNADISEGFTPKPPHQFTYGQKPLMSDRKEPFNGQTKIDVPRKFQYKQPMSIKKPFGGNYTDK